MSDSKNDSIEAPELKDSQLAGATGGADLRAINAVRVTDSAILSTSRLKDILSRFRDASILGVQQLRPFDRGSLVDIPSSN